MIIHKILGDNEGSVPFSKRLIQGLEPALAGIFLSEGIFLNSITLNEIQDDEFIEQLSGEQLTFTIKATAYMCNPKGKPEEK